MKVVHHKTRPGIVLLAFLAVAIAAASQPSQAAGKKFTLRSKRASGAVDRVEVILDVGGDLKIDEDRKVKDLKMSVAAKLNYWEKTLQCSSASSGLRRAVRFYDAASAVIKVEETGIKPELSEDRRLIAIAVDEPKVTIFSPDGLLAREELDLLDVLGNSLVLDRLLPEKPVAVGDTWQHNGTAMAALLGLDSVAECDVVSTFDEMTDRGAKLKLEGTLRGRRNGAETALAVKAKYRFDHRSGRVEWFGLLVQEERAVGHVTPGVSAVARLQLKIVPEEECEELTRDKLQGKELRPNDTLLALLHRVSGGGCEFNCGRDWFVTRDERDLVVLQQLDGPKLVARCQVTVLPKVERENLIELDKFQDDVEKALGKHFGQFVRASQTVNERNYRVFKLIVHGTVSSLPIQWVYYHLADEHGHQASAAFTIEQAALEDFGQSDVEIIESMQLSDASTKLEPEPDPAVSSANAKQKPAE